MGIFSNTLQKYLKDERVLTHGPLRNALQTLTPLRKSRQQGGVDFKWNSSQLPTHL